MKGSIEILEETEVGVEAAVGHAAGLAVTAGREAGLAETAESLAAVLVTAGGLDLARSPGAGLAINQNPGLSLRIAAMQIVLDLNLNHEKSQKISRVTRGLAQGASQITAPSREANLKTTRLSSRRGILYRI